MVTLYPTDVFYCFAEQLKPSEFAAEYTSLPTHAFDLIVSDSVQALIMSSRAMLR